MANRSEIWGLAYGAWHYDGRGWGPLPTSINIPQEGYPISCQSDPPVYPPGWKGHGSPAILGMGARLYWIGGHGGPNIVSWGPDMRARGPEYRFSFFFRKAPPYGLRGQADSLHLNWSAILHEGLLYVPQSYL